MNGSDILALVLLGVVVFFFGLILYFVPIGLWITALFSGVRVRIATLIGMRLRKVPPGQIVRPLISATKAEIDLEIGQMEAHFLAGGNVGRVVDALISADRAAIDLPWQRATAIDLAGRDGRDGRPHPGSLGSRDVHRDLQFYRRQLDALA